MLEYDGKRFRNLIRGMGRMYGQEPDNLVLDAYWMALRDWEYAEFEQAAAHLMATAKFMPRPADFNELRKAARPSAAEAWDQALQFARSLWHPLGYRNGSIGDRAIDLAVGAIGGYPVLAMADVEKLQWLEKRFTEAYETTAEVESARQALPSVAAEHTHLLANLGTARGQGFTRLLADDGRLQKVSQLPQLPAPERKQPALVSARDKVAKLLRLDLSDEAIAKVSGESVEFVRELRGQQTATQELSA